MRKGSRRILVGMAWCALLAAGSGEAQETDCTRISDDAARLLCYDKLHGYAAPGQRPSGSQVLDSSSISAQAAGVAEFGMSEQLRNEQSGKQRSEELSQIQAKVLQQSKDEQGRVVLQLDNGLQWRLLESHWAVDLKPGDEVVISKGALDSFRIRNARGSRSIGIRRIE